MKKLLVLFVIAVLLVTSLAACDFDGSDELKKGLDKLTGGFNQMVDGLGGMTDIEVVECPNHADKDNDHNCDLCQKPMTECEDESKDHKCDLCQKVLSKCQDSDNDHKCDVCSATLTECRDSDNDHKCNLCGRNLSACADANKDHKCDVCQTVTSKCADSDSDHNCDLCGKELSVCVDENDDNACDICGGAICVHVDVDKNHECDLCDRVLSDHADEDEDHVCDLCEECIHEYEQNYFWHPELVSATCCTPGVAVFECLYCDDYYTEATEIDPEAHAFWGEEEIITEANCQTKTNGLMKVGCANGCGETTEVEIYYFTVHEWDVQKDTYPTCTEDGGYYAVCTLCGEIESYESPASGHYNWYFTCGDTCECMECGEEFTIEHNTEFSPANCQQAAYCMNCWSFVGELGDHVDEDEDHVCDLCEACVHEYEQNYFWHPELVSATCCTPGVAVFECLYCDDYYTEATEIDPEAHAFWGEEEIITEANCQTKTNGLMKVGCANGCGETTEVEIYYFTVHEWDVQKDKYPTCTEDGGYYAVCTLCGEVESYESPASGHYNWYFTCGDTCECMECGEEFTIEHNTEFSPANCQQAAYCMNCWSFVGELGDHVDEDEDNACDVCGEALQPAVCEKHVDEDGDNNCDVCGILAFENVNYTLNISDLTAGKLTADLINGKFTIVSGSEIRNRTKTYDGVEYARSVKIGNDTTLIKVSVPGTGKLSFLIQNGSSGAATQFITVTGPDGTVYDIEFDGTNNGSPVVKLDIDVTEGEWIISRGKNGGTQDVFYLALDCKVEISPECGFEIVTEGKTDYLVGESLDLSGLVANAIFENGKTDPINFADLVIDTSLVNLNARGVYEIKVSYKEYDPITFEISVYEPSSIELGFDAISTGTQSGAGNGIYFNNSFKESYKLGEELDLTGLSATVVATLGDSSLKFLVETVEVTGFDSATAGAKVLKVNYEYLEGKSVYAEVTVYVVGADYSIVDGVYQVKVEKSYDGAIGAIVDGYNMFTTVQQALDFLAGAESGANKVLLIGEGLFEEKLEILIPNLTVKGAGADKTTIEWDSIYGQLDASGFSNVTDSTQTVAVREAARGCVIEDITISNYWNTQERMDDAGLEIERGLALLVQADMFVMKNSALLGIQDTLELFTGRQYFENVYISGYTDFIFGTNNTTYFKNCTIHVVDTVKDDKGTAGYLTAFKGSNKGAQDAITYGAIFDGCKFTADEGVTAGKTAIGRTWGAYAAVAIINSELGGHISLDGYDSAENKNKRYISMNGIHPTDETVQFVEYNNTGAGAITEAVAGMTMLTADEAAVYADFAVIFGTTNKNVSYLDPWDPTAGEVAKDDRIYYYFTEEVGTSGTSYNVDTTLSLAAGETYELGDLVVDAGTGKAAWNANSGKLNMKAGASIKFSVKAGSTVTVVTHSGYGYYTINGVATSHSTTFTKYFAEDIDVVILSTGDLYIASVVINPGEEAPEAPELDKIVVSGVNTNYTVGNAPSFEGIEVKANYSDNSVAVVTDYTIDSSAVKSDDAGSYDVVISFGGQSVTVTLVYEDPDAAAEITKDTLLDFSTPAGLEEAQNNKRVTIEGSVRHNGAEIQIQGTIKFPVKAGTAVTVKPYYNSQYASYTIGMEGETDLATLNTEYVYMAEEDGVVVYTGLSNNYLVSIDIKCPLAEGKYVFGGASVEGDVTGILASIQGLTIEGTCKTHSGGAQLGADSGIFFTLPASATVTIKGFDTSYGQLEVYAGEDLIEMNSDACYVFTTVEASLVKIYAVNVGTDEAPAWNKSYITYIDVVYPKYIEENTEINFGSEGNYKDSGIDFTGANMRDNGGNNSQMSSGSFSFNVKAGAIVKIHGYPGYTSYKLGDGTTTTDEITDEYYTYTATADVTITITAVNGNNYFYSISVVYPVEEEAKDFDITFGSDGNYKDSGIDFTGANMRDNGGNNSQMSAGSFSFNVKAGAIVKIHGYPGYTSYKLGDGTTTTDEITDEYYTYIATADVTITITAVNGNNYFYGIEVKYSATEPETPHEHVWSSATCTKPATCECGETNGEALGHSFASGVCSVCGAEDPDYVPEPKTYTINFSEFEEFAKGTYADGEKQEYDEVFTFYHGKDSRIDGSSKTFDDGFSGTQRFGFGGKFKKIDGAAGRALEINATGAGTVTIWWVSGGDGRSVDLLDSGFKAIDSTGTEDIAAETLYITTFEISEAGVYYLTNVVNNNYWFKVEFTTAG